MNRVASIISFVCFKNPSSPTETRDAQHWAINPPDLLPERCRERCRKRCRDSGSVFISEIPIQREEKIQKEKVGLPILVRNQCREKLQRKRKRRKNLVWYINLVSHIRICSSPDFDFHVPGVSSMSLDTHKYGYALKGTSVCLYANKELRQAQYFCYADWTGGLYTTPTLAGTFITHILICIFNCWPY